MFNRESVNRQLPPGLLVVKRVCQALPVRLLAHWMVPVLEKMVAVSLPLGHALVSAATFVYFLPGSDCLREAHFHSRQLTGRGLGSQCAERRSPRPTPSSVAPNNRRRLPVILCRGKYSSLANLACPFDTQAARCFNQTNQSTGRLEWDRSGSPFRHAGLDQIL